MKGDTGAQGITGITGQKGDTGAASPAQMLSLSGDTLFISDGNSVTLPAGGSGEIQRFGNVVRNTTDFANDNFVFGSTSLNDIAGTDDNDRFFFNKSKGAFRAGRANIKVWDNDSVGIVSFAVGSNTKASGSVSTAMGQSTIASGANSFAMGRSVTAPSFAEIAIGINNTPYTFNSAGGWNNNDRLFSVGNSSSANSPSNAFTIMKSGNIAVGNITPTAKLHVDGQVKITGNHSSAALNIESTTGAVLLPRLTTAQRNALTAEEGMMIYNKDIRKFQGFADVPSLALTIPPPPSFSQCDMFYVINDAPSDRIGQSFTAATTGNISAITISEIATVGTFNPLTSLNDIGGPDAGTLEILQGDDINGSVLYSQPITYAFCLAGCEQTFTLNTPFPINTGTSYTFRFSASLTGAIQIRIFGSACNNYSGGQAYPLGGDIMLKLFTQQSSWVDLH